MIQKMQQDKTTEDETTKYATRRQHNRWNKNCIKGVTVLYKCAIMWTMCKYRTLRQLV